MLPRTLLISEFGAIEIGACDSLTARASHKSGGGPQFISLNVLTMKSQLPACSEAASFAFETTVEVSEVGSPFGCTTEHDDVPGPPHD